MYIFCLESYCCCLSEIFFYKNQEFRTSQIFPERQVHKKQILAQNLPVYRKYASLTVAEIEIRRIIKVYGYTKPQFFSLHFHEKGQLL